MLTFLLKRSFLKCHGLCTTFLAYTIYKIRCGPFRYPKSTDIWLIGGGLGEYYEENSGALHRYIRKNFPNIDIYWVIKKGAKENQKIVEYGPTVYKNSIKTNLMCLRAKVIICAHSLAADICRYPHQSLRNSTTVYLDHGVKSFKKTVFDPFVYDIMIASGPDEQRIKEKFIDKAREVLSTGLPMHDTLYEKNRSSVAQRQRSILFMLTWRNWLVNKKMLLRGNTTIFTSDYFLSIEKVLTNERLAAFLSENHLELRCLFHRNMHVFYDQLKTKFDNYCHVLPRDVDYQAEIVANSLLITDYSSLSWEFLVLNKPTIFFQFDRERYLAEHGAYIDFSSELYGALALDHQELTQKIEEICVRGFSIENKLKADRIRQKFLTYFDGRSCERVCEAIFAKVKEKSSVFPL